MGKTDEMRRLPSKHEGPLPFLAPRWASAHKMMGVWVEMERRWMTYVRAEGRAPFGVRTCHSLMVKSNSCMSLSHDAPLYPPNTTSESLWTTETLPKRLDGAFSLGGGLNGTEYKRSQVNARRCAHLRYCPPRVSAHIKSMEIVQPCTAVVPSEEVQRICGSIRKRGVIQTSLMKDM